jgi:ribosomal protein L36
MIYNLVVYKKLREPSLLCLYIILFHDLNALLFYRMKTHSSLKLICKFCQFVNRKKRVFVVCKDNPKHKQV